MQLWLVEDSARNSSRTGFAEREKGSLPVGGSVLLEPVSPALLPMGASFEQEMAKAFRALAAPVWAPASLVPSVELQRALDLLWEALAWAQVQVVAAGVAEPQLEEPQ